MAALAPKPDLPLIPNPGGDSDLQGTIPFIGAEAQLLGAAKHRVAEIHRDLRTEVCAFLGNPNVAAAAGAGAPQEIFQVELEVAASTVGSRSTGRCPENISEVVATEAAGSLGSRMIGLRVKAFPKAHLSELVV